MFDTTQDRTNLEVAGAILIFRLREYVIAEVAKYLQELKINEGGELVQLRDAERMIDGAIDKLADDIKEEYVRADDISDALDDYFRYKTDLTEIVDEAIKESDYSSRIDNMEQKLNKLIDLLSDMKANIREYQ